MVKIICTALFCISLFSCDESAKEGVFEYKPEYPNVDSILNLGKKIGRNEANIAWGQWLLSQRRKGNDIADNFLNGDHSFDRMKVAYSRTINLLTDPNPFDSLSPKTKN